MLDNGSIMPVTVGVCIDTRSQEKGFLSILMKDCFNMLEVRSLAECLIIWNQLTLGAEAILLQSK